MDLDSSTVSNFWGNLRRQAATALTSSMTAEEKTELLEKMGHLNVDAASKQQRAEEEEKAATATSTKDDTDEAVLVQKSIEEAVAQARMEEAQMQEQRWNQEKEQLLAEAEQAAMKRVQNELRIQKFQKWQRDVNKAKETAATVPEIAEAEESNEAHPLLGAALVDLGYKRVHLASAKHLATIQVWKVSGRTI